MNIQNIFDIWECNSHFSPDENTEDCGFRVWDRGKNVRFEVIDSISLQKKKTSYKLWIAWSATK